MNKKMSKKRDNPTLETKLIELIAKAQSLSDEERQELRTFVRQRKLTQKEFYLHYG